MCRQFIPLVLKARWSLVVQGFTMLAFAGFVGWTPAHSQIEHLDLCSTPRPQHLVTLLSSSIRSEILQDLLCVSFAFAVCLFLCGCDHSFVTAGLRIWWWSDRQVAWSMCTIFNLNLIAWRRTCHIGTKASEEIYTERLGWTCGCVRHECKQVRVSLRVVVRCCDWLGRQLP
jgi:hypothetical protein